MDDYEYDVFLSYTRDLPFGPWVRQTFFNVFASWLKPALGGRVPRIFFDTEEIQPGAAWGPGIRRALAKSRCLVAVWSPDYFVSEWCVRECCVMLQREEQLGYRSLEKPGGLIVPVQAYDREYFPVAVRSLVGGAQSLDVRDYVNWAPAFERTEKFTQLIDLMRQWTAKVAQIVREAPPWRPEWLSEEWLMTRPLACEDRLRPPEPYFPAPSLV